MVDQHSRESKISPGTKRAFMVQAYIVQAAVPGTLARISCGSICERSVAREAILVVVRDRHGRVVDGGSGDVNLFFSLPSCCRENHDWDELLTMLVLG
jgi:hypothetical protein